MKFNIIIPFRPCSKGGASAPSVEFWQNENGEWNDPGDAKWNTPTAGYRNSGFYKPCAKYGDGDELKLAIKYLNKNSAYKHNIIVVTDADVHFHKNYLKEYDNVTLLNAEPSPHRLSTALLHGVHYVPDDEWIFYSYVSDLICPKNWDVPIVQAIEKYGEKYVYAPEFTEVHSSFSGVGVLKGLEPTPSNIWNTWRKNYLLLMPAPNKDYFTEDDMNYFIKRANEANNGIIIEKPGVREYGYYTVFILKAKYGKAALRRCGGDGCDAFDLDFDNRLDSVCGLQKAVVTNSFIFHPFYPFKEE